MQKFIIEVNQKFAFLEEVYGYRKVGGTIGNLYYYPDSEVKVQYVGKSVGVEVYWYFAGANIGVVFVELKNGKIPAKRIFFGESNNDARAINLYSLAGYLNKLDDKDFLLRDIDDLTIRNIKKREKVIKENMSGIIGGLASAVSKLATSIIAGDTSIFREVMNYQNEITKARYS